MLLFTEAHLEYNAGLVISTGNRSKHSPMEHETTAAALAKSLQECRLALVSGARPPVNPSDTAISGTMFTPFVGTAMQTALDLCMVACPSIFGPAQSPAQMTLVLAVQSSGRGIFFPRVRTPCGHGAQVIVEGREEQTDGGERNEGPKTNPKPNTQARRPKLHHHVVFPLR